LEGKTYHIHYMKVPVQICGGRLKKDCIVKIDISILCKLIVSDKK